MMVIGLDTSRISRLDVEMSVYTVKIKIERKGKTRRPDTLNLINLGTGCAFFLISSRNI